MRNENFAEYQVQFNVSSVFLKFIVDINYQSVGNENFDGVVSSVSEGVLNLSLHFSV